MQFCIQVGPTAALPPFISPLVQAVSPDEGADNGNLWLGHPGSSPPSQAQTAATCFLTEKGKFSPRPHNFKVYNHPCKMKSCAETD